MRKEIVNIENSNRPSDLKEKYLQVIKRIEKDKLCPFCFENLLKYHKKPILLENKSWIVTENMYPYSNSKLQILFIHKRHIFSVNEIKPSEWKELNYVVNYIIEKFKIKGGAFAMRFGNTKITGASVSHLHCHILVPKRGNALFFKVG